MPNIIRVGATGLLSLSLFFVSNLPGFAQPASEHNPNGSGTTVTSGTGSTSSATTDSQTESEQSSRTDHTIQSNSNAGTEAQSAATTNSSSESGFSLGSPQDGNPKALPSGPPGGLDPNAGSSKLWGNGPSGTPPKPAAKSTSAKAKKRLRNKSKRTIGISSFEIVRVQTCHHIGG